MAVLTPTTVTYLGILHAQKRHPASLERLALGEILVHLVDARRHVAIRLIEQLTPGDQIRKWLSAPTSFV